MNRRESVLALLALGANPLVSRAQQQGKIWRVGFLVPQRRPPSLESHYWGAFARGMRELGYVEGSNLAIEWRFADGKLEQLPELAAELVRLKVDIIVTGGVEAPLASQKATATIPIIIVGPGDPVAIGLVKSLARPGGNTTGLSSLTGDLVPKRLEMLLLMLPKLSRVAFLVNPSNPTPLAKTLENVEAAGRNLRLTILRLDARTPQEIETAFSRMVREKADALMVSLNPLFQQQRSQIAELSRKHRLPCMTADRIYAEAGCLMSYGNSLDEDFRRAASYVDKIFKGAKPGDLPVEQPTKFELVINGKTAKSLGLAIPKELMLRADWVIE